ncbi:ABC transporter ATP-binding protein [Ktedonobacter sp. SOSP1-85]|uniref:ABC transporter ATP-binding protein n=1 Tax=Ktedonobacter sp. SOSP1-85 TaxID=2778367 RepID=UPI001914EFFF|nr:ABC transporter ATP-binding protein [Ktedonobacter sp. SOSP1-85]GHO77405.1 ABC transporter ATP-binding protein [Ktedonobacter sp. SOSP1-85]
MEIVIEHVTKRYGLHEALRGIDVRIGEGIFGLLGPNGAGKTTLLRILATLRRPGTGRVLIGALDISQSHQRKAARSLLGYLPQDFGVYPDLTGYEFLDYMGLLKGLYDRSARRQQIEALCDVVNLAREANRKVGTYSGGMKRRLGIAQALLGNPYVLIFDEPTAGLDPEERIRLRTLLTRIAEGRIVILSTHVVEDISHTCERLGVLDQGTLTFDGQTRQLIEAAAGHAWQFLAAPDYAVPADCSVISMLPQPNGVLYHIVGSQPRGPVQGVQSLTPGLEDGYVWLRQQTMLKRTQPACPTHLAP